MSWISYLQMKIRYKSCLIKTVQKSPCCTGSTTIHKSMQITRMILTRMATSCGAQKKTISYKKQILILTGTVQILWNLSRQNPLKWSKNESTSWKSKWTKVSDSTSKISSNIDLDFTKQTLHKFSTFIDLYLSHNFNSFYQLIC